MQLEYDRVRERVGNAMIIYAHQDDDLLWMLPFWPYATKFILAGYPFHTPSFAPILDRYPEGFRRRFVPLWGTTDAPSFFETHFAPCNRDKVTRLDSLKHRLVPHFRDAGISSVVTHNNWGEYGHHQHRLVNQAVRELAVRYRKDVWTLAIRVDGCHMDGQASQYRYTNIDTRDLETLHLEFDHQRFIGLRAAYANRYFAVPDEIYRKGPLRSTRPDGTLDPEGKRIWTWRLGNDDYPSGRRPFIKIVNGASGIDHSAATAIQRTVNEVAVFGRCAETRPG